MMSFCLDTSLWKFTTILALCASSSAQQFLNTKVYSPFNFSWVPDRLKLGPSQRTGVCLLLISVGVGCFTQWYK